jgi:hypothetical protein
MFLFAAAYVGHAFVNEMRQQSHNRIERERRRVCATAPVRAPPPEMGAAKGAAAALDAVANGPVTG